MATIQQCEAALESLAQQMATSSHGKNVGGFKRAVSCQIPDLGTGFRAQLADGTLHEITEGADPGAQITLTASSDDLVAITSGELGFTTAWATGRLKIDASFSDLMQLRALL